jgi:hypothetical protein
MLVVFHIVEEQEFKFTESCCQFRVHNGNQEQCIHGLLINITNDWKTELVAVTSSTVFVAVFC